MREELKVAVPLGMWSLTSGKWFPNDLLIARGMSEDVQRAHNIAHGFGGDKEPVPIRTVKLGQVCTPEHPCEACRQYDKENGYPKQIMAFGGMLVTVHSTDEEDQIRAQNWTYGWISVGLCAVAVVVIVVVNC